MQIHIISSPAPIRQVLILLISILSLHQACTPKVKTEVRGPGPQIRVLLATIDRKDTLHFTGPYILQSEEAHYEFGKKNKDIYIQPLKDGLQLFNQNRNLLYRQNLPIVLRPTSAESRFVYHGKTYTGIIYFQFASENRVSLINKLLLEDYLKGVVPAEIPANKQDDYEAIKAQAICARTYALKKMDDRIDQLYDVQSTVADQVYGGVNRHAGLANRAIEESRGVIITYEGKPATIYYHSTCGGQLEAAHNIFTGPQLPYLSGGEDAVGGIYSCNISPYFRWEEIRTIEDIDRAFLKKYNKSLVNQTVTDTLELSLNLGITERDASGRVREIKIEYADTTVILSGYEIRRFFSAPGKNYLRSNLFYLSQTDESTLTIYGAGYGHGVGMCQFGALHMAREGFQHYHILSKYFPQTKLLRKY
jgi:stage II sporulation protein D